MLSQQGLLATYLIPGCVGRGVRLGSESSSGGAGAGGVWESGNLEIWKSGNLEIQKSGVHKIPKIKIIKIKIRVAQNVGQVWISRKQILLALFHAIPCHTMSKPLDQGMLLEIWEFGDLGTWGPGNPEILRSGDLEIQKFGVQKMTKIKILRIQIRSAQNVGKVWISRKKILLTLFGAI